VYFVNFIKLTKPLKTANCYDTFYSDVAIKQDTKTIFKTLTKNQHFPRVAASLTIAIHPLPVGI